MVFRVYNVRKGKGKGKRGFVSRIVVNTPLINALRYGMRSQGISVLPA